jgi:hypothetical protein
MSPREHREASFTWRPRGLDFTTLYTTYGYTTYGQLFTRLVTFGLPNPVAKSQPECAG